MRKAGRRVACANFPIWRRAAPGTVDQIGMAALERPATFAFPLAANAWTSSWLWTLRASKSLPDRTGQLRSASAAAASRAALAAQSGHS